MFVVRIARQDPFEDESQYPGVAIGARASPWATVPPLPVGSYYGYATGIVGLRLFPNPTLDAKAAKNWDPERYYTDPTYYNRGRPGAPLSCRHVMRILPCRPEPYKSTAGSRARGICEFELLGGRSVHVGGPGFHPQRQ